MRPTAWLVMAALFVIAVASARSQEAPLFQEPPDLSAYRPIYDPTTPALEKAELAEAFLADERPEFLNSTFRENVFLILFQSYRQVRNWEKVLETVNRLETILPETRPEKRVAYYLEGMSIADKELDNADKAIAYARKILEIDPNNVNARQVIENRLGGR